MATLQNVKVTWSGIAGLNGYSNHYFLGDDTTAAPVAAVKVFYEAIKANFPTGMRFSYPSSGNVIDETTGTLTGGWSGSPQSDTAATGPSNFNSGQGAIVEWRGMGVVDGKRPVGKTFLVPWITGSVGGGTIPSSTATAVTTAAQALITATAGQFVIWHRPVKQKLPPHSITRVGGHVQITSATCPAKMMVLTSRRD